MAKVKRLIEVSFLVIVSAVVLAHIFVIFLGWRESRLIKKETRKSARAAVTRINPRFPPRLLVEFENAGKWPVRKMRLVAIFESDGREIARAEREYAEVKPGEKRTIMLESLSLLPPGESLELPAKIRYRLLVFPGSRKPLPEITGDFDIE
ncbi:MAG: hypothetical protein FJY81_04735 [Candidatus Aminicenantes bacterium]|nr:hypothetical protein [Candidatus Aminicenantes bacterium]